LLLGGEVARL